MQEDEATAYREAIRGASVMYETLAEGFARIPDEQSLKDLKNVAHLFGCDEFDGYAAGAELEQRYYDRFFVSTSNFYVPLSESCIINAIEKPRGYVFGPIAGRRTDHVLQCYKKAGFDYRALKGFDLVIDSLKPDSLISELAFMAFLREGSARQPQQANVYDRLALDFLKNHLASWIEKATCIMTEADDDLYARLCALTAQWVKIDVGQVEELFANES